MIVNYTVDENNRLQSITKFPVNEAEPTLNLDNDFDINKLRNYLIEDNQLKYDPYLPEIPVQEQINILKQELQNTDYVVIKIAEGAATEEEYADVIKQRQEWRKQINEYEKSLNDEGSK